jgi:hypothetical protein
VSHCIELPISGRAAWDVRLDLPAGGSALDVTRGDHVLATMNTETYAVTEPTAPGTSAVSESRGGGISAFVIGAIMAAVTLIGTALAMRRRRLLAVMPPDPFGPGEPEAGPDDAERDRAVIAE